MLYVVSVSSCGTVQGFHQLEAPCALDAIESVEAEYPAEEIPWPVYDKNGNHIDTIKVSWTGLEFQAKEIVPC